MHIGEFFPEYAPAPRTGNLSQFFDFEGETLPFGWGTGGSGKRAWDLWSGTTGSTCTGPLSDHTTYLNASQYHKERAPDITGQYMYTEMSGLNTGDLFHLFFSDPSIGSNCTLEFWLSIEGSEAGELTVVVEDASGGSSVVWSR